MKIKSIKPPRVFRAGASSPVEIKDCARIRLAADEQVTFVTPEGSEYDVTRKSWGFYAAPSLNGRSGRLAKKGFKTVLVKNSRGKFYLLLVERNHQKDFERYKKSQRLKVVRWF